jgi:hypothetical protein
METRRRSGKAKSVSNGQITMHSESGIWEKVVSSIRFKYLATDAAVSQSATVPETWWNELNLELQIFYAIGVIALLVLLIQLALSVFGGMDDSYEIGHGDHGSGLSFFSIRGVTAFFTGFGWSGVIALKAGFGVIAAISIGSIVGFLLMLGIFLLMKSMLRLQSSGTLDFTNAVGKIGTVYVTVPADKKAGGQVELLIQGRLTMADALSRGTEPLRPGTKVTIVEKIGHSTLIVEPLL